MEGSEGLCQLIGGKSGVQQLHRGHITIERSAVPASLEVHFTVALLHFNAWNRWFPVRILSHGKDRCPELIGELVNYRSWTPEPLVFRAF